MGTYGLLGGRAVWEPGAVPESLVGALHRSVLIEATRRSALFRLATVGRFSVAPGAPVVVDAAWGAVREDIECMLRGPVGALRSLLEGEFALRGAAVCIRGQGVVIAGQANGTSTLAGALGLGGQAVVADGTVVVSGVPPAAAGLFEAQVPAMLTLWPDSAATLGLDVDEGAVIRPSLPSRGFSIGSPWRGPARLRAVIALGVDSRLRHLGERVIVRRLTRFGDKLPVLLRAQWHPQLALDLNMQQEQFRWATNIAKNVPIVLLTRSTEPMGLTLPELVRRVEEIGEWDE